MPRFEPFTGIRYNLDSLRLDDVVAPPYDVIDPPALAALEARSPYNVVHIDLAHDEDGRDRYTTAGCRFEEWLATGVLQPDPGPGFYAYRMGFHDADGRPRQTVGVLGALEVSPPDAGDVLPHERTTPRARDDRLRLLRACRADLSPVWGLSLASGLSALCTDVPGTPVARCTDGEGVHHRLWRLSQPGIVEAVAETVASAPVVLADGHHRYQTALTYRDERRAANGGARPGDDLLLALVSELGDSQTGVRPIHRLVGGLPSDFDILAGLEPFFELAEAGPPLSMLPDRMAEAGALALVLPPARAWLLVPRADAPQEADGIRPDSDRLDTVLSTFPSHTLSFDHSLDSVASKVASGEADAGVLLRPVTVSQIALTARAGGLMPPKTTYFHPKPRTGIVFRRLAD